jgi:hypothetical protein
MLFQEQSGNPDQKDVQKLATLQYGFSAPFFD